MFTFFKLNMDVLYSILVKFIVSFFFYFHFIIIVFYSQVYQVDIWLVIVNFMFTRVNVSFRKKIVLVYSNQDSDSKRFKVKRYYLPKRIIDNYNVIINGKNFYDQAVDSDIKQYEEIGKLTTGQGEDYTTGCLLDYDYIKNHYRLIAVDLSRQK